MENDVVINIQDAEYSQCNIYFNNLLVYI